MWIYKPGDVAQYRKVGRVEILGDAQSDYQEDMSNSFAQPYRVRFLTGPKKYRETSGHVVWLTVNDAIPSNR